MNEATLVHSIDADASEAREWVTVPISSAVPTPAGTVGRTVLVTDSGRGSAISILRSLGKRGCRVIAADSDPHSPGFRCRWIAGQLVYPNPATEPKQFVDVIEQAARRESVDLIVPVTDAAILPLSAARARFTRISRLAMATAEALATAADKWKTFELAQKLGIPAPRTRLCMTPQEVAVAATDLRWPVVLKSQASWLRGADERMEKFGTCYADCEAGLGAAVEGLGNRFPVLMQEYYPGTGVGVELLMHEGRPLAAFQHQRLREFPVSGGPSAMRESVPLDAALYDHSVRLLRELSWTGLAMVEFKIGVDGPKLVEINGRVWGSLPLAVHSGMDFPARLADLYLHGPPDEGVPPDSTYAVGVRSRNLELDLKWIASVLLGRHRHRYLPAPRRREAILALLQLLNPVYRCDVQSLFDPGPGLAQLSQMIPKYFRKLSQKRREAAQQRPCGTLPHDE